MAKTLIEEAAPQMENLQKRMGAGNTGASVLTSVRNTTKSDPSAAQFTVGDKLAVPTEDKFVFQQNFGGNDTYGVICAAQSASGEKTAKSLYFSMLDRSVAEYDDSLKATGVIKYAKTDAEHEVFDKSHACATVGEVYDLIKGKTLEVIAINQVKAARYNAAGQVTRVRTRNIPVFKFA